MFNMNIKPRLAEIESGAIVEDTETRTRGFLICNEKGKYQVVTVFENGRMFLNEQEYDRNEDVGMFFSSYKMVAQHYEYEARIEGAKNAKFI